MDARMTLCNMSIEGGARAGMVPPDEKTFSYLQGKEFAPSGQDWERMVAKWEQLPSDDGAEFDRSITIDTAGLEPMITYGTNPGMGMPLSGVIPDPDIEKNSDKKVTLRKALEYMDLKPGDRLLGRPVDVVFLGSCTNSRISDLRDAARLIKGSKVAENIRMIVVPGSESVRREAEAEGLDRVFKEAGAEWRFAGCSMCIAMNGDQLEPGQSAISTSNRNFEGRQGKGGRTFLTSPITAAATAISGVITDPRGYIDG
jgi:3-isopropylmalate/(R)-2-methylmalate dehydratase large subunit